MAESTRFHGAFGTPALARRPWWWMGLFVALLLGLPAAGADEDTGEELYRRDCASCHGPRGEGSRRGPDFDAVGEAHQVYYLHTGRMPILSPSDPVARKPVPYSDEQLTALVDYASSLGGGPDLPQPQLTEEGLSPGGVDYRLHCAICHGAAGDGGALAGGQHAPSLMEATPEVMMAAMTAGPGAMPSFESVLSHQQRSDVATYIVHLQQSPGVAGSVPAGRVGEGLVGLAAAIVLVAAARLIGDRE